MTTELAAAAPTPAPGARSASFERPADQESAGPALTSMSAPGELTQAGQANESDHTDQPADDADAALDGSPTSPVEGFAPPVYEAASAASPRIEPQAWYAESLATGRLGDKPNLENEMRQILFGRGVRP